MNRLAPVLGLLCAALIVGGCGGSGSSASVASTSTSSSIAVVSSDTTATSSTTITPPTTTTSATSRTAHRSKARHTGPGPSGPVGHDGGTTGGSGGRGGTSGGAGLEPAQFGRLSAAFTITSRGGLDPTAVSLPPVGSITLAVVSRDGRQHRVQLRMPSGLRGLTVPAHGRATAVLHAVKPGRYVVEVDGLARGLVLVGGTTVSR